MRNSEELEKLYEQEETDIEDSIKDQNIFRGSISGYLTIKFNKKVPETFKFVHLNTALTGVVASSIDTGESEYSFMVGNSSIYEFFEQLGYIHAYSVYKGLHIEDIKLEFNHIDFEPISDGNSNYRYYVQKEIRDIDRSTRYFNIFVGAVYVKYKILIEENNKQIEGEGAYTSVYKFVSEIQKLRDLKAKNMRIHLYATIMEINDKKVRYDENIFILHDENC